MKNSLLAFLILLSVACARQSKDSNKDNSSDQQATNVAVPKSPVQKADIGKVKVYIENTLSMHGYFFEREKKVTKFRNAINELLLTSKDTYGSENVDLSLINNAVSVSVKADNNLGNLGSKTLNTKYSKGFESSDFDKLFDTIIHESKQDELVVFIADFIYSPPPNETDVKSSLIHLRQQVKSAFVNAKGEKPLVVNILHMESDFHGNYFDIKNNTVVGIPNRPYYIFIIGSEENVSDYSNKVVDQLQPYGLLNKYFLSPTTLLNNDFSALPFTLNKGQFEANGILRGSNSVKSVIVENISSRDGNLELAVAVDLSNIPVSNDYLLNTVNYSFKDNRVKLIDIGEVDGNRIHMTEGGDIDIKSNDIPKVSHTTHVFLLSFPGSFSGTIDFSLVKNIPPWVDDVSLKDGDDDLDIKMNVLKQSQTFGFAYIVNGIYDAQKLANPTNKYFQVSIDIKHESPGSGIGTIIGWIVGLVFIFIIVLIFIRNKQRK